MTEMASKLKLVRQSVKVLNARLQNREVRWREYHKGMEAIFELLDQDWVGDNLSPEWVEGYEQCMVDIVDALGDEWGVILWLSEEEL
jgi:hypothetical protein